MSIQLIGISLFFQINKELQVDLLNNKHNLGCVSSGRVHSFNCSPPPFHYG